MSMSLRIHSGIPFPHNITIKTLRYLERQIHLIQYDHCSCQEGGECVDSDECSENPCGLFGECINRCHHYHRSSHHRCLCHHFCRYHGSDQVSTGVSSLLSISILNLVIISLAITNQLTDDNILQQRLGYEFMCH